MSGTELGEYCAHMSLHKSLIAFYSKVIRSKQLKNIVPSILCTLCSAFSNFNRIHYQNQGIGTVQYYSRYAFSSICK